MCIGLYPHTMPVLLPHAGSCSHPDGWHRTFKSEVPAAIPIPFSSPLSHPTHPPIDRVSREEALQTLTSHPQEVRLRSLPTRKTPLHLYTMSNEELESKEKKAVATGCMDAEDSDGESSEEEEGELEVAPPPPRTAFEEPPAPTPTPQQQRARLDEDSDEEDVPAHHISQTHELTGLKLALKPGSGRGRGYRSGIAHSVTREMSTTSVVVGQGAAGAALPGSASYGDDTWGGTTNTEFVGTVGGIRPNTRPTKNGSPRHGGSL